MNQTIPFLISSHSSRGYVSFYRDCFGSLERVEVLSGWPKAAAEKLFEGITSAAEARGLTVWRILHSLDGSVEGLVFPERSAGVYLSRPWDGVVHSGISLSEVYRPVQESLEDAHRYFASALPIHDQWEAVYIAQTDFARLDSLAQETISHLLDGQKGNEEGRNWMRFLGAATHLGSMDVVPEITQSLTRRIFIKGRPGTGKSTFLKKIRAAANEAGWDTEEYRCAFDPNSADMVVIRGLRLCLFDSTSPHEHFPERPGDEILDLYEAAVTPGTDEANAETLREIAAAYKAQIRLATGALHAAWESWSALEATQPWEEKALQQEQERILQKLL